MDIDDFLSREEFKKLNERERREYLIREMHKTADRALIAQMIDLFGTEEKAQNWFYRPIPALEKKRPYDVCKKGEVEKVKEVLDSLDYSVFY